MKIINYIIGPGRVSGRIITGNMDAKNAEYECRALSTNGILAPVSNGGVNFSNLQIENYIPSDKPQNFTKHPSSKSVGQLNVRCPRASLLNPIAVPVNTPRAVAVTKIVKRKRTRP